MYIINGDEICTIKMGVFAEIKMGVFTIKMHVIPGLRACHSSRENIFSAPLQVFSQGFFQLLSIPIASEYQPNDTEGVIS
jgi:hypothetical protein